MHCCGHFQAFSGALNRFFLQASRIFSSLSPLVLSFLLSFLFDPLPLGSLAPSSFSSPSLPSLLSLLSFLLLWLSSRFLRLGSIPSSLFFHSPFVLLFVSRCFFFR